MKAEFKETPVSHVGLYKFNESDLVVMFSDENDLRSGVVIVTGDGFSSVGEIYTEFHPCTDASRWTLISVNEVTFKW